MAEGIVGVEIADSGMRLVAALDTERGARRWSTRLPAPPAAEEALTHVHALIARAVVVGEGRPYVTALLVPDWAAAKGFPDLFSACGRGSRASGRSSRND